MTIKQITEQIKNGKLTAVQAVTEALERAKQNEDYKIFVNLTEKRALARAEEIDRKIAQGELVGPLAGVPFAIKDNILAYDASTTASSKILNDFKSPIQATVVDKLEAAGAISIGKTNLDSFAHGSSTENSAFFTTKNAVDKTRVPGGSSGGSAVVVARGIVPFSLGTDTGGSIRQPASFNGVIGIKPTYGLVSRFGAVAMASSTDVIGCFTTNAEDADLVISIMSGRDQKDMTTYDSNYQTYNDLEKLKLALPKQFMADSIDDETKQATLAAVEKLKKLGHTVEEVDFDVAKYALAIYYIVVSAEVSSNLARYDGVRYAMRADSKDLASMYSETRASGFEPENKRRIMIGSFVLSSGYFDAYYLKAQKVRTILINRFKEIFENYDFIIGPVTPEPAFKIGQNTDDPLKMYISDLLTTPASLAGLPAVSVPNQNSEAGLPIGFQIMGPLDSDAKIVALIKQFEEAK